MDILTALAILAAGFLAIGAAGKTMAFVADKVRDRREHNRRQHPYWPMSNERLREMRDGALTAMRIARAKTNHPTPHVDLELREKAHKELTRDVAVMEAELRRRRVG